VPTGRWTPECKPADRRLIATTRSSREDQATSNQKEAALPPESSLQRNTRAYACPMGTWNSHPAMSLFDVDAGDTEDLFPRRTTVGGARIQPSMQPVLAAAQSLARC
jgi:hypothetical protein